MTDAQVFHTSLNDLLVQHSIFDNPSACGIYVDGIYFVPSKEHGEYFGMYKNTLLGIPMMDKEYADCPPQADEIHEITCIEDGDTCLEFVNQVFGTHFKQSDFFGR